MRLISAMLTACLALAAARPVLGQQGAGAGGSGAPPAGWRLVWADEFNVDGWPDPRNWGYEVGFVRNAELQWYQPDNAWCEGGLLIIEGRREVKANRNFQPDHPDWRLGRE